jgi:hypothetical protein
MPSVSLQQAAAQVLAAVQRAQALFGPHAHAPTASGPSLGAAVQPLGNAGQQASTLSGVLVNNHRSFVDATTRILERDEATDRRLQQVLARAAAVVQHGRTELDAIVARTRALAVAAMSTRDAAGGRALLQALRSEVFRANSVVNATKAQAGGIAGQVRALDYGPGEVRGTSERALGQTAAPQSMADRPTRKRSSRPTGALRMTWVPPLLRTTARG